MKITGIHAANFLCFAPPPADFHLDNIPDPLCVIVGPNGAGKSSILRATTAVLNALPAKDRVTQGLEDIRTFGHVAARPHTPWMRLRLDVTFDRRDEIELICALWACALIYPGGVGIADADRRRIEAVPDRLEYYARWASDRMLEPLRSLRCGVIILEQDLDRQGRGDLYFESGEGLRITLDSSGSGTIQVAGAAPGRQDPLCVAAFEARQQEGAQLARFLEGADVSFPLLAPIGPPDILRFVRSANVSVSTVIEQPQGPFPGFRKHLNVLLGREPYDTNRIDLGYVITHLVQDNLVVFERWHDGTESPYVPEAFSRPATLLTRGDLPTYLFHLKNVDTTGLFEQVQTTFRHLTGRHLDVLLHTVPPSSQVVFETDANGQLEPVSRPLPAHQELTLVTDNGVPLRLAGSGWTKAAYLSALLHQHAGKVVFLDEPDTGLHASLQTEVAALWRHSAAQHLIVSHSPFMIPRGLLSRVRRVFMPVGHAHSTVALPVDSQTEADLGLPKHSDFSDEILFLFARTVVFVEGGHEAAALPVWFDECFGPGEAERLGVRFHDARGKSAIAPLMRIAEQYGVPCLALYDADVLRVRPDDRRGRNENREVLEQWAKCGYVPADAGIRLGDPDAIGRVPRVSQYRIFLRGSALGPGARDGADYKFETLPVFMRCIQEAVHAVGHGSPAYRWIAERAPCPEEFREMFRRARRLALAAAGRSTLVSRARRPRRLRQ